MRVVARFGKLSPMVLEQQSVSDLSAEQLRELATRLLTDVRHKQAVIDKLTHEYALLKRLKFAAQSERYSAEQRSLLDETLDTDLQAVSEEIAQNASPAVTPPENPFCLVQNPLGRPGRVGGHPGIGLSREFLFLGRGIVSPLYHPAPPDQTWDPRMSDLFFRVS